MTMTTLTRTIDGEEYSFEIENTVRVSPDDGVVDFHELMADHTRVLFEGGDYRFRAHNDDEISPTHCIVEVVDGATATFAADNWSTSRKWLVNVDSETHIALHGIHPDNGAEFTEGDVGMRLMVGDGLLVEDVDHIGASGAEPVCQWSIYPHITSPDGTGEFRRWTKTGPSLFQGHGASDNAGGIFENHEGRLVFQDCQIKNQGGDGGIYGGKYPGQVVVRGGEYHTNDMAVLRTGAGEGCEYHNVRIVIDWENAHTDNLTELPDHPVYDSNDEGTDTEAENVAPSGTNGVYLSSAQYGKTGGGFYGCTFIYESTYDAGVAMLAVNNSDGGFDLHDCTFVMNADGMPAIWARTPDEQRFGTHETPPKPWGLDIRNLTIKGSGDCGGRAAIVLNCRHETVLDDVEIKMPNAPAGIDVRDCDGVQVGTVDITVGGPAIQGETHELVTDGGTNGGSDSMPDTSPPDDSTDRRQFTVQGTGDYARYRVEVSGGLWSLDPGEEAPNGARAQVGHIAGNGTDPYEFTGEVAAFEIQTGDLDIQFEGESVTPAQLVDQTAITQDGEGSGGDDSSGSGGGDGSLDDRLTEVTARVDGLEARVDKLETTQQDQGEQISSLRSLWGRVKGMIPDRFTSDT